MKIKLNYIVIPLIVFAISTIGSLATKSGMHWYDLLKHPIMNPPKWVFGYVWTFIYICAALSALIVWNRLQHVRHYYRIISLFVVNGFLNLLWPFLFFVQHKMRLAFVDCVLIAITTFAIIYYIWPHAKKAAYLLIPYAAWVSFACYLNYHYWMLNTATLLVK